MYYIVSDEEMTSVANAIREKTEKSGNLVFPDDFTSEINAMELYFRPLVTMSSVRTVNKTNTGNNAVSLTLTETLEREYMYLLASHATILSGGSMWPLEYHDLLMYVNNSWQISRLLILNNSNASSSTPSLSTNGDTLTALSSVGAGMAVSMRLVRIAQIKEVADSGTT